MFGNQTLPFSDFDNILINFAAWMQIWDLLTKLAVERFSSVMGVLVCDNNQSICFFTVFLLQNSFLCHFSVTVAHQGMQREFSDPLHAFCTNHIRKRSCHSRMTERWIKCASSATQSVFNLNVRSVICGWFLQKPHGEKQKQNYNVLSPPL